MVIWSHGKCVMPALVAKKDKKISSKNTSNLGSSITTGVISGYNSRLARTPSSPKTGLRFQVNNPLCLFLSVSQPKKNKNETNQK
jgi:hypothetical protein